MPARLAIYAALVAVSAGCTAAAVAAKSPASKQAVHFSEPLPAERSTARLAIASGRGARRLTLWTATNARKEVCAGWRLGPSSAPPTTFTCLHRGLERAIVSVESGGGPSNANATWGVVAGLASPRVARVSAETLYGSLSVRELTLRAVPSLAGWHAFTTGIVSHPTAQNVKAFNAAGDLLVQDGGGWIHASGAGSTWSDVFARLPESKPADHTAIAIAIADPAVRSILSNDGAWLDDVSRWTNCNGKNLGRVISFRFAAPVTFAATLPVVDAPAGKFSYSVTIRKVLATNWHTMDVWVDTNTGVVVGVDASGFSGLPDDTGDITIPVATVTSAHDAGGPDSGDCWQSGN